jgi:hypothetical protein
VKGILPRLQPKVLARGDALVAVKSMGTKKYFWKFTCRHEESEKDLNSPFGLNTTLALAGTIRSVSSIYWTTG